MTGTFTVELRGVLSPRRHIRRHPHGMGLGKRRQLILEDLRRLIHNLKLALLCQEQWRHRMFFGG